jgi:hypothetical protein
MITSKPIRKKPGRSRYDQEHPTRSFRLKSRESNERLEAAELGLPSVSHASQLLHNYHKQRLVRSRRA